MLVLSEKPLSRIPGNTAEIKHIKNLADFAGNRDAQAIVCCRATAAAAVDMDFPALRLIQLTSAGFDNVPVQEYAKRGIAVANAGSVYSTPIAETVVYGMLSMAKKYRKNPNNHFFRLTRGYKYISELLGKNVLIMGAGSIGTEIAERLSGFKMNIYGYDPYCPQKEQYISILRTREELKRELPTFDYVLSTMPDTAETKGFIDKDLLDEMNNSAVFVNVGRRAVINEDDLYAALKNRSIGGAVLDMFEKLPNPVTNRFRRLTNTIIMPGVAAISNEVNVRLEQHICDNILLLSNDKQPNNVVNGVRWEK